MKVVCVASFLFGEHSGANSVAKTHIELLYKTYGKSNVTVYALAGTEIVMSNDYIVKNVSTNKVKRIVNLLQGNTGRINKNIEKEIVEYMWKNDTELLFVDDSIYGKMIKKIKRIFPALMVATYYHDIKRNLVIHWMKKHPKSTLIYLAMIYNEYLTQKYSDFNLVLNYREECMYEKYYRKKPERCLPVVLPLPTQGIVEYQQCDHLKILFVGGYYYPNVNGFKWFVSNVLPMLKRKVSVSLVGNGMQILKDDYLSDSRICVLGRVEDLEPIYREADIVIGPIFEGAGMKVKTAEAFSYGKVFIGTDESMEGYLEVIDGELLNNYIFICNTKEEFAEVLNNLTCISKYVPEVYDFFYKHFSIEVAVQIMKTLIKNKCYE